MIMCLLAISVPSALCADATVPNIEDIMVSVSRMDADQIKTYCGSYDPATFVKQIKSADIINTYKNRVSVDNLGNINIEYHWLETGCCFQIYIVKKDEKYQMSRLWLCR